MVLLIKDHTWRNTVLGNEWQRASEHCYMGGGGGERWPALFYFLLVVGGVVGWAVEVLVHSLTRHSARTDK